MDTRYKLNRFSELKFAEDSIHLHYNALRNEVLTPEIKAKLSEIDAEEVTALDSVTSGINKILDEIKADVLTIGASVKGDHHQAVFAKGRVSWDTKALDGYAAGHPEVLPFRKEGEPSVSIRAVK